MWVTTGVASPTRYSQDIRVLTESSGDAGKAKGRKDLLGRRYSEQRPGSGRDLGSVEQSMLGRW